MTIAARTGVALAAALLLVGSISAASPSSRPTSAPSVIRFELRDNLVRIPVDVNGQRQSGVLDSGAGAVLLDRQVSRQLGLSEGAAAGDAAGGGNEAKALLPITISRLSAGPLQFENLAAYAMDLGNLSSSAGFPVDVILGAPAFEKGIVSVDYARRHVTIDRSKATPFCAAPIPLEIVHAAPVIEIEVRPMKGERPVHLKVLVDLGTRHSALVLGGAFLRSEVGKRLLETAVAKEVGFGVGGAVNGAAARVADVRAGRSNFGPLEVSLTSNVPAFEGTGIDGTLGVPLWIGGVIAFDYEGRRLCITRQKAASRAPSKDVVMQHRAAPRP
ncbi:retropepsin-like aspartic protease [Sphingomonas sp. VNH70]|jgi:hypothetical protein|uniref:retropepsin-like aspartic protease n=1 Tax=Sphingomonas silueang TaxID=3156617 RepID=UPI0032B4E13F